MESASVKAQHYVVQPVLPFIPHSRFRHSTPTVLPFRPASFQSTWYPGLLDSRARIGTPALVRFGLGVYRPVAEAGLLVPPAHLALPVLRADQACRSLLPSLGSRGGYTPRHFLSSTCWFR
mgnify:CR=1 FL=1